MRKQNKNLIVNILVTISSTQRKLGYF